MDILDQLKSWTPDKTAGRSDFDDLAPSVYRPRVARESVRIVDATAGERSAEARAKAALRGKTNTNTDYATPKYDTRPFQDEVGQPTEPQRALIIKLVNELVTVDAVKGQQAAEYTVKMTNNAAWKRGKGENTSRWISTLIDAVKHERSRRPSHTANVAPVEYRAAAAAAAAASAPGKPTFDAYNDITDGNYAVVRAGKTHFYRITRKAGKGQYAGRTFLNIQERASEELFPVRGAWHTRKAVLDSIRSAGVAESHLLYSERLTRCWHCNILLTDDTTNPYRPYGLGPICGPKVMG